MEYATTNLSPRHITRILVQLLGVPFVYDSTLRKSDGSRVWRTPSGPIADALYCNIELNALVRKVRYYYEHNILIRHKPIRFGVIVGPDNIEVFSNVFPETIAGVYKQIFV